MKSSALSDSSQHLFATIHINAHNYLVVGFTSIILVVAFQPYLIGPLARVTWDQGAHCSFHLPGWLHNEFMVCPPRSYHDTLIFCFC